MYRKYLPWHLDTKDCHVITKKHHCDSLKEEKLTLLNWNVHKNNHHYKWLQDFATILDTYQPNLVAFQEYKKMGRRSILDQNYDFGYSFFPNIAYKQHLYGLLSAGKSSLYDTEACFSHDVEPLLKTPKITLSTKHKFSPTSEITLVNVHMINFVKIKKYIAQMNQIQTLCQQKKGALILTGDFNTWSEKRMRILKSMTTELGLKSVQFYPEHHKKPWIEKPLDHIFYRGLKQHQSTILKEINSSDHKPMLVTFSSILH